MGDGRPNVKNAADGQQVEKADKKLRLEDVQEKADWKEFMNLPSGAGKRIIAMLLAECGIANSPWRASAEIHRLSGHMEIGQLIYGKMVRADSDLSAKLLTDEYKRLLSIEDENKK